MDIFPPPERIVGRAYLNCIKLWEYLKYNRNMEFIWRKAEDRSGRAAFWRLDISGAQVDALVTEQGVDRLVMKFWRLHELVKIPTAAGPEV